MTPALSLVVLGYRNFEAVTAQCLNSLQPWIGSPDIEIFVVDNGSPDDSGRRTQQWCDAHPPVRCLISDHNRGFAGGMNWGAGHASADWLLLVNNDTVFPAGALDSMLGVIAQAPPDVAMLGPVTNAAGNGQRLWNPGATHADWIQVGEYLHRNPTHTLMPTYRCDFFCIAIRRDVWQQLGGLDETFGLGYYEDFDFSLRLRARGYQQMITEDVFVLHTGSATFQGTKEARALIKKNKKILKNKHPNALFEHTRLGNLLVLKKYAEINKTDLWGANFIARLRLRFKALTEDVPRSYIKRQLWRLRVGNLVKELVNKNNI